MNTRTHAWNDDAAVNARTHAWNNDAAVTVRSLPLYAWNDDAEVTVGLQKRSPTGCQEAAPFSLSAAIQL